MNEEIDMMFLKQKVDMGADYIVTQMCFDNDKIYRFIERCREAGINVPVVPGLKPIVNLNQRTMLPKTFRVDLPNDLALELVKCKDDVQAKQVGVEWCAMLAKDLYAHGIPSVHFYSHNATESVRKVLEAIF